VLVPSPESRYAPLDSRMNYGFLERVQRALCEGRERSDGLDRVPEELDSNRLSAGGGKDVDEAATHRELAALLSPLGPFVAGEGEAFRQFVYARLVSRPEPDSLRSQLGRRKAFGETECRRTDQPSSPEDLERSRALADEVRRRLEAALPADAAGGEKPDVLVAEKPARSLGDVAGVAIVGQKADDRALASKMESREEK
jgi:hypothetical protein